MNRPVALHDAIHPRPDSTSYDAMFATTVKDAKGQVWTAAHNALGWDTTATDPQGVFSHYTYTPAGHVATMTNRRGEKVTYKYDKLGRLLKKYDPVANDSLVFGVPVAKDDLKRGATEWVGSGAVETDTTYQDSTGWTDSVKTDLIAAGKKYVNRYWPAPVPTRFGHGGREYHILNFTWAKQKFVWDTITGFLDSSYVNTNGTRYHYTTESLVDSTYYSGGAVQFDTVMDTHQRILTKFTASSLDTAFHRMYLYDSAVRG